MKKIIFYSVASFVCVIVWMSVYHAELISVVNFEGDLEFWRVFIKTAAMFLSFIFMFLLAYECSKKDKPKNDMK